MTEGRKVLTQVINQMITKGYPVITEQTVKENNMLTAEQLKRFEALTAASAAFEEARAGMVRAEQDVLRHQQCVIDAKVQLEHQEKKVAKYEAMIVRAAAELSLVTAFPPGGKKT
jgi:hypothetical protein